MSDFQQGFPVSFDDFLGAWIPGSLLKSHPVVGLQRTKELHWDDLSNPSLIGIILY